MPLSITAKLPQHHSVSYWGIPIVIEWPKNSVREGKDKDGRIWRREMKADYGFIDDTSAAGDAEPLDIYIGDDRKQQAVYVIEQLDESSNFDEFKLVTGVPDLESAQQLYLSHYPKEWGEDRLGDCYETDLDSLRRKVEEHQEEGNMNKTAGDSISESDIAWWTRYTGSLHFKTEEEAREWLFRRLQHMDTESYAQSFGVRGEKRNRQMSLSMPLYRVGRAWKIGKRPARSPVSTERLGTESPPSNSYPPVAWNAGDNQDAKRYVIEADILRNYAPKGKTAIVYRSFVEIGELPDPKLAESRDQRFHEERNDGYDWEELAFRGKSYPPVKILVSLSGKVSILDGNHRLSLWSRQGYIYAPCWVIDQRRGINLEEEEEYEGDDMSKIAGEDRMHQLLESVKGTEDDQAGTVLTGFYGDGPATCMDCIHRTPHSKDENGEEQDSCNHKLVKLDPELAERRLPDGTIKVDADDWCRFAQKPKKEEGESPGKPASRQEVQGSRKNPVVGAIYLRALASLE